MSQIVMRIVLDKMLNLRDVESKHIICVCHQSKI